MDATWWDAVGPACVIISLLAVPGVVVTLAAGARIRVALAAGPLVSLSVVAASAAVAPLIGMSWGVGVVLLGTAVAAIVCIPSRVVFRETKAARWDGPWWLLPVGVLLGGGVHAFRLVRAIANPNAVSQTFDSPFHANLVRSMLQRSDGSFLHVTLTNPEATSGFYPAAWHELVSLAVHVTGAQIPVATNAATLVVTALVWPLGVSLLLGTVTRSWWAAAAGGLVSCVLPQMPNHLTWFGVLYPNLLAYSVLGYALALLWLAVFPVGRSSFKPLLLLLVGLLGLGVAHPSALFSLVVLSFPLVLVGAVFSATNGSHPRATRTARGVGAAVLVAVVFIGVNQLSMTIPAVRHMRLDPGTWAPIGSVSSAIARAVSTNAGWSTRGFGPIPFLLGTLIVVGMLWAFRRPRTAWLPFSHLAAIGLYTVAFADTTETRAYVVGPWYGDTERLVALVGVTAAPLLGLGCVAIGHGVAGLIGVARRSGSAGWSGPWSVLCAVLVLCAGQFGGTLQKSYSLIGTHFMFDTSDPAILGLLSLNEYELLERLPEDVPATAEVLGNPWNGSVFTPAVGDRDFAFPHVADVADSDAMYVAAHLSAAGSDPRVCDIVSDRHMRYVLDFGDDFLWGGDPNGKSDNFPGLEPDQLVGVTRLVDQQGSARLLEITACDG